MCYDTIYNPRFFTKSVLPCVQIQQTVLRYFVILWCLAAFGYVYISITHSVMHGRNPRYTSIRG